MNAALKEFAQKGFTNASTNEIVKEANISKGLLFHYFSNKKDLFLFLYDYTLDTFVNEFFGKMDLLEKDVLARLRQMAYLKIELLKKHPEIFKFILVINIEDSVEVKSDLASRNKEIITASFGKLFGDLDISKFKEGIDIARAINIITWTLEGFATQMQEKIKLASFDEIKYDELLTEMDVYLEILKSCFYKEE